MANRRITMQDIADACGLSRNTVSKVFNGRSNVTPTTRAYILQKAEELGYGVPREQRAGTRQHYDMSVALLTHHMPVDSHFGTFFVTAFTDQISRAGYTLKMYEISDEELAGRIFPPDFSAEQTAGILGIELFDAGYLEMICSLGIPTVFIDSPVEYDINLMPCDFLSTENTASVTAVTNRLIKSGARRIGFVGDLNHCGSFHERWIAFCNAMGQAGLEVNRKQCILDQDSELYGHIDWLIARLGRIDKMPDAFVCANDFLAIHLMAALKQIGLSIPDDIMITGFDGTPQSAMVDPCLTTVGIPGPETGRMAADMLLNRIKNPALPYCWTRVRTTPVWRKSTGE